MTKLYNTILSNMPNYRLFSNQYTHSSSDYTNYKKVSSSRCTESVGPKGTSPYFCLMTCNKANVLKCEEKDLCNRAPINLEQGKTSYICRENILETNVLCKEPIVLYPYGKYLCDASTCNTC